MEGNTLARPPSRCADGYAQCFARARVKLESWMRGEPLDVDQLAEDLRRLPDGVCVTLMRGLPAGLCSEVLETVRSLRRPAM